jgi:hypothetical protein
LNSEIFIAALLLFLSLRRGVSEGDIFIRKRYGGVVYYVFLSILNKFTNPTLRRESGKTWNWEQKIKCKSVSIV